MTDPMSIDTPVPRLGWRLESSCHNVMQTSAHIIVASSREKAEALEGDLWDTTLEGDQSQWVRYNGAPIGSNTRCYWRVKVLATAQVPENVTRGQGGADTKLESPWSSVAMWNVGLLTESDWRGRWIGYNHLMPWDIEEEHSKLSSRYLRKSKPPAKPESGSSSSAPAAQADPTEEINAEFRSAKKVEPFAITVRPSRASGWVNMRWAPSKQAEVMATYKANEKLLVIKETANWYQVEDQDTGDVGFISKQYVAK